MASFAGLNAAQRSRYLATILGDPTGKVGPVVPSHGFTISAEVLTASGKAIEAITPTLIDGQVNIQRSGAVRRTATLTFLDPNHALGLDAATPFAGPGYLNRMIRVTHTVKVPTVGPVSVVVFVGPISSVSREDDLIRVQCQDKAAFAVRGRPILKVPARTNTVTAIRRIMAATGEDKFRLPAVNKPLKDSVSVAWADDTSPWVIASRLARSMNRELMYSADGYLMARRRPTQTALELDGRHLTSAVQVDYDATRLVNTVRIEGTLKTKSGKLRNDRQTETRDDGVALSVSVRRDHPLSPQSLGRNGKPRHLPLIVDGKYKSKQDAQREAQEILRDNVVMNTAAATLTCIPFFHLDAGDVIMVDSDGSRFRMRLDEASIPLGVSGDMSIGFQTRVSTHKARRRAA